MWVFRFRLTLDELIRSSSYDFIRDVKEVSQKINANDYDVVAEAEAILREAALVTV